MKEGIEKFEESFKKDVAECQDEEIKLRLLETEYFETLDRLQKKRKTRLESYLKYREDKLHEIDVEIQETNYKLKLLRENRVYALSKYCREHKHHYVITYALSKGKTGLSSVAGEIQLYDFEKRCTICGDSIFYHNYETVFGIYPSTTAYEQEIPNGIYDNINYSRDGKTVKMIDDEIEENERYLEYLKSLKRRLCSIFGHDADDDAFVNICSCCGEFLSREEVEKSYKNCLVNIFEKHYFYDEKYIDLINHDLEQNSQFRLSLDFPKFK